ncbi:lipoprotein-releasing system transmembrane subunit LolC, partial [BEV proteobacterium]|nr:lipoprotein-releasing system transmembrane subunit LolC [Candidatus Symbiopectobacterium sp. Chty_BC]
FVSWLSAIGITLGVMALVTVLSVMNGFEQELEESILGLMSQAVVTTASGSLDPQALPASSLSTLQGIMRIASITTDKVVL